MEIKGVLQTLMHMGSINSPNFIKMIRNDGPVTQPQRLTPFARPEKNVRGDGFVVVEHFKTLETSKSYNFLKQIFCFNRVVHLTSLLNVNHEYNAVSSPQPPLSPSSRGPRTCL